MTAEEPVARFARVSHRYGGRLALDGIDLVLPAASATAVIGPDGVGKSTLLGLLAGAKRIQSGEVLVLGGDMASAGHRAASCPRIAYMPQGLGRNLCADLSVRENIAFFGRLFGQAGPERDRRIGELLEATGLAPFPDRPARNLSGGMRQKLGLCCALIHDPDLLILDEPTTGVDPLSRRQFWDLIERMRGTRPGMSVIVATAYMEEAERFAHLVAMDAGRVLFAGTPADIRARTGGATLEASFLALLPQAITAAHGPLHIPPRASDDHEAAIIAKNLTRRFGRFLAVDDASFTIERGEIFGFLGSNGCGKTTTMKMLTGLLEPTSGSASLFGRKIDAADMRQRWRVGYMSQSFSLYTELTIFQNLELHARLYHLEPARARTRIAELIASFGLAGYTGQRAASLPLGIRQRLSLAVAVVHEPELLILDEPTSGVDPLARDRFWELLADLSRKRGVTIFVSTHFMNEAERCDRISLMHAGRVLATGTPAELAARKGVDRLEDAFIAYLSEAEEPVATGPAPLVARPIVKSAALASRFSLRRLFAYALRETLELRRDPVRLGFAVLGTAFLMLALGFGINTDVDHLSFAAFDRDRTPESIDYLKEFRGSIYFTEQRPITSYRDLEHRLASGSLKVALEIPPGFGRNVRRGRPAEVGAWIDGAMPFWAETAEGYLEAAHQLYLSDLAVSRGSAPAPATPTLATIESRFRYNQDFESTKAMVPGTISMLLALIPSIMMAVAVVREKELGSITNLYVTPVTRLEFILGKQLPYIALAMASFLSLCLMAIFVFAVPLRGSFAALAVGALIYVTATTGYGLLISSFASTQIAALFGTAILTVLPATTFSGMLTPVSTLTGLPAVMGRAFPMTYFLPISVGAFTKALGFSELAGTMLELALFVPIFTLASLMLLPSQER